MKKKTNYQLVFLSFFMGSLLTLAGCVTVKDHRSSIDKQRSVDNYVRLGMAYLQQNNRDAARRNLEKALTIDSRSAQANSGMGLLYQLNGEFGLSEKYHLKSIRADASYTHGKNNYGLFLYQQKRYQEAYDLFSQVTQDLSYDRRAYALAHLGRTALKLGKRNQAKSAFEHALNINSKVLIAVIELAEIYFNEKNYAQSKRYLDQYSLLSPQNSPRSLWLGIRIERIFGNKDKEASYALALRNLYPYSNEYLKYQATLGDERR